MHTLDGQLRVAPVVPHAPTRGTEVAQTILPYMEAVEPCVMVCTLDHYTVALRHAERLRPSLS
eukprot:6059183-Alexandrium_andersonii.AAC.1